MVKNRIGREDVAISGVAHPNAEVDIVERNRELLRIEAANLLENGTMYDQTCRGYGGYCLGQHCAAVHAKRAGREVLERVPRDPADAQDETRMLDAAGGGE